MKPIELIENALLNSSIKNNIIIDYFSGSGSTLIACEKTGRICYGMELDEHYCDVIIERYCIYTGNYILTYVWVPYIIAFRYNFKIHIFIIGHYIYFLYKCCVLWLFGGLEQQFSIKTSKFSMTLKFAKVI